MDYTAYADWLAKDCERCPVNDHDQPHTNADHQELFPVNTLNEYMFHMGRNLPNHTMSENGRGQFVRVGRGDAPVFRTKQEIYRFCAWALTLGEELPDEEGSHTLDEVTAAIHNS